MATQALITAEQFDQLPEDSRYELLDGELIEMPSANLLHNAILVEFVSEIRDFLKQSGWGVAVVETEFAFGSQRRLRPDLAVLRAEQWVQADLERVPVTVLPDIAVEIVSPS